MLPLCPFAPHPLIYALPSCKMVSMRGLLPWRTPWYRAFGWQNANVVIKTSERERGRQRVVLQHIQMERASRVPPSRLPKTLNTPTQSTRALKHFAKHSRKQTKANTAPTNTYASMSANARPAGQTEDTETEKHLRCVCVYPPPQNWTAFAAWRGVARSRTA